MVKNSDEDNHLHSAKCFMLIISFNLYKSISNIKALLFTSSYRRGNWGPGVNWLQNPTLKVMADCFFCRLVWKGSWLLPVVILAFISKHTSVTQPSDCNLYIDFYGQWNLKFKFLDSPIATNSETEVHIIDTWCKNQGEVKGRDQLLYCRRKEPCSWAQTIPATTPDPGSPCYRGASGDQRD